VGSANLFESNLFVAALAHSLSKAFESSRLLALACNHGTFNCRHRADRRVEGGV
jgi:hypothetical protein